MKTNLLAVIFALLALGPCFAADDKPDPGKATEEQIARIRKILVETRIDSDGFQELMPLSKFLQALEASLPEGKKITLRIDAKAFGKDLPEIAGAPVKLPPRLKGVRLVAVLRLALAQVAKEVEVDYGIRPDGVVITRPRLAAYSATYDVRDIVEHIPLMLSELRWFSHYDFQDLKASDGPALLVRLLANTIKLQPWETVQALNDARLVVHASPTRHEEIQYLFDALRRLADLAVYMNARLYEVDRAFFTKQVLPLLAKDKDSEERHVLSIEGALLKRITKQKLILESEDVKIRHGQRAAFFSLHSAFRFAAAPEPGSEDRTAKISTGFSGVSFEVRPLVSPDRRSMRLQITQNVTQLMGIDKIKKLDLTSGKEVEVQSPNVRKSSVTGTVDIPDYGAILMPVDYRPPGKEAEDKVWLMVARPIIWIEVEVAEWRNEGREITPKSAWEAGVEKPDPLPQPPPLPLNDDVKEILQAVITDLLTNPKLKSIRDRHGTAKDKTLVLMDGDKLGWPREFHPATHGYQVVQPDPFVNQRRILGICLYQFDLKQDSLPIHLSVVNAGGWANGAGGDWPDGVVGGDELIFYEVKRVGNRWTVELKK